MQAVLPPRRYLSVAARRAPRTACISGVFRGRHESRTDDPIEDRSTEAVRGAVEPQNLRKHCRVRKTSGRASLGTLIAEIRGRGGAAATHELLRIGATSHQLTAVVASGDLIRPRQGWYMAPGTLEPYVRAFRVGGRLAGVSAAETYDLAVPRDAPLHVHVPHSAARLRSEQTPYVRLRDTQGRTTVVHRGRTQPQSTSTRLRVGVLDCLAQVALSESEDDAVACIDSAVHAGPIAPSALGMIVALLPARLSHLPQIVDGRSDSYLESIARRKLAIAGIHCEIQVPVLGERWIDLVIGDRLAIELDGAGKYQGLSDAEIAGRVHADRERDAFLEALGFHVIRLSYRMVLDDWPATLSMIQAVMDRGDHLRSS